MLWIMGTTDLTRDVDQLLIKYGSEFRPRHCDT